MWDTPKNHAKVLEKQKTFRYGFYDIETMQAVWNEVSLSMRRTSKRFCRSLKSLNTAYTYQLWSSFAW